MNRREFLAGTLSGVLCGGCRGLGFAANDPRLVLGVVSDIHITAEAGTPAAAKNCAVLKHTLEVFRERGVDGVIVAGDIADGGKLGQLQAVADTWNAVFPGGLGRDGRKVEKLFVSGNHDWRGQCGVDYAGNWERVFGEKFEPVWMKELKGYRFVGAHWCGEGCHGAEEKFNPFLREFYAKHADELMDSKPFFHIQHPHPKNTHYGPWAWGHDDGTSSALLKDFPNAIALSGHSHYTLVDDRGVWQGDFTSIGTGSLCYNCATVEEKFATDRTYPRDSQQGFVMTVYNDHLLLERIDFGRDVKMGPDWVVPLDGAKPFAPGAMSAAAKPPCFAKEASASFTVEPGEKPEFVRVGFAAAEAALPARAYYYEVTGEAKGESSVQRFLASDLNRTPGSGKRIVCNFSLVSFKVRPAPGDLSFTVVPISVWRHRGSSIGSIAKGRS